jgi:hypothetical protein
MNLTTFQRNLDPTTLGVRLSAPPRARAVARCVLACASLTVLTACEAQKPSAQQAAAEGQKYAEPEVTGKVIDAQTKQPIKGALIYGHYATSSGTLAGGSKFGEHVKSFLAETDANGVFKLAAWDTGERPIKGETRDKFPMIAIYKPGYRLDMRGHNSIRQWIPPTALGDVQAKASESALNWTASAFELKPATTEIDRYNALDSSGYPIMMVGECGWELFAPLLLAQHSEWKGILQRSFPADQLNADGYSKGTYNHPDLTIRANQTQQTAVDTILKRYAAQANSWGCANPMQLFKANQK